MGKEGRKQKTRVSVSPKHLLSPRTDRHYPRFPSTTRSTTERTGSQKVAEPTRDALVPPGSETSRRRADKVRSTPRLSYPWPHCAVTTLSLSLVANEIRRRRRLPSAYSWMRVMSESPESMMDMTETPKYFPQAVPSVLLSPV